MSHTTAQKILLYLIYGLVLLMVLFSLIAIQDKSFSGYKKCVEKKCERGGEKFCQKSREQMNCCTGAGGKLALDAQNKFTCVFS